MSGREQDRLTVELDRLGERYAKGEIDIHGLVDIVAANPEWLRTRGTGRESWHGTTTGYHTHKCRCDACRDWSRKAARSAKEKRLTRPIPDHVHGTTNGYGNYKCRCDSCRSVWAKSARELRHRRPDSSA